MTRAFLLVAALILVPIAGCIGDEDPAAAPAACTSCPDDDPKDLLGETDSGGDVASASATSKPTTTKTDRRDLLCPDPCVQVQSIPGLWEPHGVGNPADPDHMVIAFRSNRADGIETLVTRDGGQTWQDGLVAVGPESPSPVLRRYTHSGDASVAILPDGTVLVAGLGANVTDMPAGTGGLASSYTGRSIYVARSHDGGLTFPEAFEVQAGLGRRVEANGALLFVDFDSNDKEWVAAAADGTVLIAWTHMPVSPQPVATDGLPAAAVMEARYGRDFMAAVSRDGGATFGAPITLEADVEWAAANPAVGPDGQMAIAYGNIFGGDLVTYTSTDGAAWERHASGSTRGQPILLPGDEPGVFHLAYPTAGQATLPILRTSLDGGARFGKATVLDGDIGDGMSHVAFDRADDGTALVAWYDELPDGSLTYKARGIRADGSRTEAVVLASGLTGPARANGDYVSAIAASEGGGLVAWVAVADDGARSMQMARLAWA